MFNTEKNTSDKIVVVNGVMVIVTFGNALNQNVETYVSPLSNKREGREDLERSLHKIAGESLEEELAELTPYGVSVGFPIMTQGHGLHMSTVFHIALPRWDGGFNGEKSALEQCYYNLISRINEEGIYSVSLPSLSSGIYGFPIEKSAEVAVRVVCDYLANLASLSALKKVVFALSSEECYSVYCEELAKWNKPTAQSRPDLIPELRTFYDLEKALQALLDLKSVGWIDDETWRLNVDLLNKVSKARDLQVTVDYRGRMADDGEVEEAHY